LRFVSTKINVNPSHFDRICNKRSNLSLSRPVAGSTCDKGKQQRRTEGDKVTIEEDETDHCTGSGNNDRAM